jgi:hypothetical protein
MTEHSKVDLWCGTMAHEFPVVATTLAVGACFGEAFLQKYLAPGRTLQIVLGIGQAIPAGLLFRYFFVRSRKPNQKIGSDPDRVR